MANILYSIGVAFNILLLLCMITARIKSKHKFEEQDFNHEMQVQIIRRHYMIELNGQRRYLTDFYEKQIEERDEEITRMHEQIKKLEGELNGERKEITYGYKFGSSEDACYFLQIHVGR